MKKLLFVFMAAVTLSLWSCGNKEATSDDAAKADSEMATQPVESGQYTATYYDITGTNARKGKFDGRMYIALDKDQSAIYVYENGNRAKIDYMILLERPFEKNDSGRFSSVDSKGMPVVINTDSASYVLSFEKGSSKVSIDFDKAPISTSSAFEVLEKINELKSKKK